jgi:pimeloyl-ACP methyl ester carboxylesterase
MKIEILHTTRGQLEYSITGTGIPVLFLHGGHANCHETLSHKGFDTNKYMLITPSRPGYGNTPLKSALTLDDFSTLLVELLDHLRIEKCVIYSVSAGGYSGLTFAGNYPDRLLSLVLASAVSMQWPDRDSTVYSMAKRMFNPGMQGFAWGMVRFGFSLFPGLMAGSFYSQFTTNKKKKLKKEDVAELGSIMKHYSSGSGFIHDIEQSVSDSVIKKLLRQH